VSSLLRLGALRGVRVVALALALVVFAGLAPMPVLQPPPAQAAAGAALDVPFFSQRDPRWATRRLGSCSRATIRSAGCALTSEAMVFKYYGVRVSTRVGTGMNPRILNAWLKKHAGYAGGCMMRWGKEPGGVRYTGADTSLRHVNKELAAGRPVIADVTGPTVASHHFVVIIGRAGKTYVINDPWSRTASWSTLASKRYRIYKLRYFAPTR
jgi:hypothetical protein